MVPEKCVLRPLLFFLLFQMCTSVDTINGNQPITDGQVLVSAGGHFALGFFSPENSTNGNRYVGIWYNKVKQQTVVWVANRENPMKDSTGVVFTINRDGNLVVFDKHRKEALWSTNITTVATNGLEAKLLDSGNLVLSRQGIIVWQSFDYPTHTHLPGMRIGLNRKTGLNWSLTSWKSRDDPARGDYSFRIDPQGSPQSFLYKGSVRVWRSGPWNGVSWSGVPEMSQTYLFSYQFVNTSDEVYLTYNIYNTSIYSRFVLDESGLVQRQTWIDRDQRWNMFWSAPKDGCDEYGRCGPYGICITSNNFECTCASGFQPKSPADWYLRDGSEGCVRKRKWECGKGEGFLKLERVKLPDTTLASRVDTRLKPEECRNECLRNCSCTAYTSANISGSGCIAWYGDLMDIREYAEGGQDLYLRMDAIELAAQTRRNYKGFGKARMLVIVILVTVLLFLALCGSYFLWKRKRKDTIMKRGYPELILNFNTNSPGLEGSSNSQELEGTRIKSDLPFFDLSVIVAATDNFSSSNKLGQGGFGPVYKVWELWKAGRVLDVVDSAMGDSYPSHQVLRGVHVGLLCVQESASDRPTMSDVVVMLGSETALHPPKQPAFIMKEAPSTPDSSTAGTGLYSVDEETITVLEAR
uniref:non-specific serine/threonine protein kinase n=1 Tax=Nelumbo nucifera TaxID=4432 RepID=A0A822XJZ4_NELNU|nr:TPA_asm: hypothetical protein HUJ06_022163 [Nelumbo nucifera]